MSISKNYITLVSKTNIFFKLHAVIVKIILSLIILLSRTITSLSQPITLGLLILTQTILICLITRIITFSTWISLSIFLVIVGGLIVIFMYVTRICSNVKFKFNNFKFVLIYVIIPFYITIKQPLIFSYFDNFQLKDNFNLEFIKLFLPLNIFSSIFAFLYLLIALVIMIRLIQLTKGPLRKKY